MATRWHGKYRTQTANQLVGHGQRGLASHQKNDTLEAQAAVDDVPVEEPIDPLLQREADARMCIDLVAARDIPRVATFYLEAFTKWLEGGEIPFEQGVVVCQDVDLFAGVFIMQVQEDCEKRDDDGLPLTSLHLQNERFALARPW